MLTSQGRSRTSSRSIKERNFSGESASSAAIDLSALASSPEFYRVCHTKAQYMEEGPRIARHNPVFNVAM